MRNRKNLYIAEPCKEILNQIKILKKENNNGIVVSEIGVGIGATTMEILKLLEKKDILILFDYTSVLNRMKSTLHESNKNGVKIVICSNSNCFYDSYSWKLLKMVIKKKELQIDGYFDLVYLDGAHTYLIDSTATCALKELMKLNGRIVFDDYGWSMKLSPTNNLVKNTIKNLKYTVEQIQKPHIKMVCTAFMDTDARYEKLFMSSRRAIYMRKK